MIPTINYIMKCSIIKEKMVSYGSYIQMNTTP